MKEYEKQYGEAEVLADPKTAAYALNLCLVSVSQIIDYADVYVLEQEYEGILNNLNLEHMPKDEALLDILRQILDTITFFRIEEEEKKFIEQEYQDRMKSAIWSAVPNCAVILGGPPETMLMSLLSQVGSGYMNYRKEKAQAGRDREKALWNLQKAAIEQFNGLRRELFTTAWKLADRYDFPDQWRLTESQIDRYNRVLMDMNLVRRLVRLEDLESEFAAYPPFWYFKGHTALQIAEADPEHREQMLGTARGSFSKYFAINSGSGELLRTDPICASCALEYVSVMDESEGEQKLQYIERAIRSAGTQFDILQLCAMAYLDMGEIGLAAKLLRNLVCEGYNEGINAQLLSAICISGYLGGENKEEYRRMHRQLRALTDEELVQWPDEDGNTETQYALFVQNRQDAFRNHYANFLCVYYGEKGEQFRKEVLDLQGDKEAAFVRFAWKMQEELTAFPSTQMDELRFSELMSKHESEIRDAIAPKNRGSNETYEVIFSNVVIAAAEQAGKTSLGDMEQITDMELKLSKAIGAYYAEREAEKNLHYKEPEYTLDALFRVETDVSEQFKRVKAKVGKELILEESRWIQLLLAGEAGYYAYIKEHELDPRRVVAVLNDRTLNDCDLIICENGLVVQRMQFKALRAAGSVLRSAMNTIKTGKEEEEEGTAELLREEIPWSAVSYKTGKLLNPAYSNKYVDMEKLFALVESCKREFENTVESRIRACICAE